MISLIKRIATCTQQTRASVPSACPRRTRLDPPSRCLSEGSRPSGKPQNRTVRQSSTVLLYERLMARLRPCNPCIDPRYAVVEPCLDHAGLETNPDGSVDIWFGPKSPA